LIIINNKTTTVLKNNLNNKIKTSIVPPRAFDQ
jgi:hypothetical protein